MMGAFNSKCPLRGYRKQAKDIGQEYRNCRLRAPCPFARKANLRTLQLLRQRQSLDRYASAPTMATALPGETREPTLQQLASHNRASITAMRSRRVPLSPCQQGSRHSLWQSALGPFRLDRAGQGDRSSPRKDLKESEPMRPLRGLR